MVSKLSDIQNIRLQVAGRTVWQWGEDEDTPVSPCPTCVVPPIDRRDLGEFTITDGEAVTVRSQITTTAGGEIRVTVNVLESAII